MDPDRLAQRLDQVQVVDVRHPDEWEAGRIASARHLPLDDLAERLDELDLDVPVVTVCRSGERSERAARWLRGEGLDAENLDGGMQAWAAAGLPVADGGGGAGRVVEPQPPGDDRPEGMQALQAGFLEVVFAAQEHFGGRQPSEAELRSFLRDRLLAEGRTEDEADRFLAAMDEGATGDG